MVEYMSLLDQVERDDVPLSQKRGMMDVLSRITQYMNSEQLDHYKKLTGNLSVLLPHLPHADTSGRNS